jgi:hypothetical protein
VAALTAMVEALRDSIAAAKPYPEMADGATPQQQPDVPSAMETAQLVEAGPAPAAVAAAVTASPPSDAAVQETALLASLEQMEVRPIPPPDEGTAVIFTPETVAPEQPVTPEPEPADAPQPDIEPALIAQAEVPPAIESTAAAAPDAAPTATDAEFDTADFLFGAEPEPDPAAFLLDPAPQPALWTKTAVLPPQPEFVSPSEPAAETAKAAPPAVVDPPMPPPERAHDPLHALRAMSENERLALFS